LLYGGKCEGKLFDFVSFSTRKIPAKNGKKLL